MNRAARRRADREQPKEFHVVDDRGVLHVNYHRGQSRAMRSTSQTVAIIAGAQSGKTCVGPHWLLREMQVRGPGDYLVVGPNYPLLNKKAIPEFNALFEKRLGLGDYLSGDKVFTVSEAGDRRLFGERTGITTQVFFGHAANADSLEASTAKAAWLDEAGQPRFKLASFEAIERRLAIHEGRKLITTTPYDLGWLAQKIYFPWLKNGTTDEIEVIRFESRDNPIFPQASWDKAKRDLPKWKFDMFFRGIPSRPAGVIYDSFELDRDTVRRFRIPERWKRYMGLDFGGVNTVALYYAQEPGSDILYLYREYKAGKRTAKRHAESILEGEPRIPYAWGGSKSEDQWRDEFADGGLPIEGPVIDDVEVGIDRVYGFHARQQLRVFDDLEGYLEEKATYRRKLDKMDQPTEEIEDKNTFHFMDGERYVLSALAPIGVGDDYEEVEEGINF